MLRMMSHCAIDLLKDKGTRHTRGTLLCGTGFFPPLIAPIPMGLITRYILRGYLATRAVRRPIAGTSDLTA
jgi:hypothetical protein